MCAYSSKENVGLTYNSVDLRAHLNSVSMEDVVEVIESMTFASTAIEKGRALQSFKISVGGPWSKTLHQARSAGHADAADDAAHAGLLCRSVGQSRDARGLLWRPSARSSATTRSMPPTRRATSSGRARSSFPGCRWRVSPWRGRW